MNKKPCSSHAENTDHASANNLIALQQDHFNTAMGVCNPSSLRETVVEVPNVKWDDIGGLEETKRSLQEMILYALFSFFEFNSI